MPDLPGVCPSCGHLEEESFDFSLSGSDLFICGNCGIEYSQEEDGTTIIVDVAPGTA